MPVHRFIDEMEMDPRQDLLTYDPPYRGQEAALDQLTGKKKSDAQENENLQEIIARHAGEFAEDKGPVIAFNSPAAKPLYEDAGLDTFIGYRPDMSAAHSTHRRDKREMIAHANIPGMNEEEWYKRFPELRIGSASKQLTLDEAFEKSWPTVIR